MQADDSADVFPGCLVTLHSLKARPDLNGRTGEIVAARLESGRHPLRVGDENLALKADNLRLRNLPATPQWSPIDANTNTSDDADDSGDGEGEEAESEDLETEASVLEAAARGAKAAGGPADFVPIAPSEWRHESEAPTVDVSAEGTDVLRAATSFRFVAALCGGSVHTCDVSTPEGLESARQAVAARRPIVMRGGASALLGHSLAAELGSTERIGTHLAGRDVSVLYAPPNVAKRFTYYFGENRYEWNLMAPPAVNKVLSMPWSDELVDKLRGLHAGEPTSSRGDADGGNGGDGGRGGGGGKGGNAGGGGDGGGDGVFYMQLSIATCAGGAASALGANGSTALPMRGTVGDELLGELTSAVRSEPMSHLSSELGVWQSSMLYIGPVGTLAPCHWDHLDNVFTQLGGTKQVLLFAPDVAGLRPFPRNHPFDSRAQVDLERPSEAELATLRGCGALATLEAGDSLFIPQHWWHHIHASDGSAERLSISLNCWFNPFEELAVHTFTPWPPRRAHVHAHVARAAEGLLISALPSRDRAADALAELLDLLEGRRDESDDAAAASGALAAGGSSNKAAAAQRWRAMRNYVLAKLVEAYGRHGATKLCRTFLRPARWQELKRVCFHDDPPPRS